MSNYNDIDSGQINEIKKGLQSIGEAIETVANRVVPDKEVTDKSISGNKIQGGKITLFKSTGIEDLAGKKALVVDNDGILVDNIKTSTISGGAKVQGDLTVDGELTTQKLHVNELTADVRNERTSSLTFNSESGDTPFGKGLQSQTADQTKQFILQDKGLWSSESIDISRDKSFSIDKVNVLSSDTLGETILKSSLTSVGTLTDLKTTGSLEVDEFIFYDANHSRLGIGTEGPNGQLSIGSIDSEFIVDPGVRKVTVGTYTTSDLEIITDNTPRLTVENNGNIVLGTKGNSNPKISLHGKVGVNIATPGDDADLSVSGPIKFMNKVFAVGDAPPITGLWQVGDIVWHSNPAEGGHVGWVCMRSGSPGSWSLFGRIEK